MGAAKRRGDVANVTTYQDRPVSAKNPFPDRCIFARVVVFLVVGLVAGDVHATPRSLDEEDPDNPDGPSVASAAAAARDWMAYAPAAVDVPQIRNLEPRTRVYIDGGYARSSDLSALPYVEGHGHNFRGSVGGSLALRRFQFDAELPALQTTTLDVTRIPGGAPQPQDEHQTALSLGDLRLGAQWTAAPFDDTPILLGVGLRGRFPTHTVQFGFHLADNSVGVYAFPYYFHIEPALLAAGAFGPLSFVMNQGPIVLVGPDANFEEIHFVVPTIYFWDSHYAVVLTPHPAIGISVELNTVFQLSHVDGLDFMKLNHIQAWSLIPGIQWHCGDYRLDVVGRIGLSRGAELVGVMGYGGTNSLTVRLTRFFR